MNRIERNNLISEIALMGYDINNPDFKKMTDKQLKNFCIIAKTLNDTQAINKKELVQEMAEAIDTIMRADLD